MRFKRCKPWVNQILSCANQNQPCVNFFAPYANPYISAIPQCFVTLPILMFLLRAAHSCFNQVKSLFGVKKSLLSLSQFSRVCFPMYNQCLGVLKVYVRHGRQCILDPADSGTPYKALPCTKRSLKQVPLYSLIPLPTFELNFQGNRGFGQATIEILVLKTLSYGSLTGRLILYSTEVFLMTTWFFTITFDRV